MKDAFSRWMAALMVALVAIAYIGLSAPLWAAMCMKESDFEKVAGLVKQTRQWKGDSTRAGERYAIYADPVSGKWTAVFIGGAGIACILDEGKNSTPEFGEPT